MKGRGEALAKPDSESEAQCLAGPECGSAGAWEGWSVYSGSAPLRFIWTLCALLYLNTEYLASIETL